MTVSSTVPVAAAAIDGALRVDVRTPGEFAREHPAGAINVPLGGLSGEGSLLRDLGGDVGSPVFLFCQTGQRARLAQARLASADRRVLVVEGGLEAWREAGLPVVEGTGRGISLERQVRIVAGTLTLLGAVLAFTLHPGFAALSGFIGAGLVFAGLTNSCGMALLLARLPWNRAAACALARAHPSPR